MGTVYRAFDRELRAEVALKTLERGESAALRRFKNEFRAMQHLEHPNLVNLGELFEHDGTWFFTMELLTGVDFFHHVAGAPAVGGPSWGSRVTVQERPAALSSAVAVPPRPAAFKEDRLRAALPQLALGLSALHDAGMVHRDIKPSNILVERDGRVVLLDFGLVAEHAMRPGDDDDGQDEVIGTVVYMSPEQAAGMPPEPASDMYSLGVMLYELLTGRLPFDGDEGSVLVAKQTLEPALPSSWFDRIPSDLEQMCMSLLDISPRHRPSARELVGQLGGDDQSDSGSLAIRGSQVRGPALVGRDDELAMLDGAVSAVRAGGARAVVVYGESGVGKSALLRELTARVAEEDSAEVIVLRGRCFERESVPFKGFDGVVDDLARFLTRLSDQELAEVMPHDAHLLVRAFPALARVPAIAEAPFAAHSDPVQARDRLFKTLRALLRSVSARWLVIITIDDMQWADGDSRVLLHELLAEPAPAVLVLLTARKREDVELTDAPGASAMRLSPLAESDAIELSRALLLRASAAPTIDATTLAREAAGHPFYIAELVHHATAGADDAGHGPVRLEDAIRLRAAALPEEARRVLELVSIAAGPVPLAAIQQAARLSARKLARHVSSLRVSSMVRSTGTGREQLIEPYHDHVRRGMTAAMGEVESRLHHERLGNALIGSGAGRLHPELLLHHLEASGQYVQAANHALDAAQRAEESFAFMRAAELLRTAIRLGEPSAADARALHLRLADVLANAGRGAEAADAYLRTADGAVPTLALECRALASHFLVATGHHERGVATMRDVLADLDIPFPESTGAGVASILTSRALLAVRGGRYRKRDEESIPPQELIRLDALEAVSNCLGSVDSVLTTALQLRHSRMALRVGEPVRAARALAFHAFLLAAQGVRNRRKALARFDTARKLIRATEIPRTAIAYDMMDLTNLDGLLDYFASEFATAADKLMAVENAWRDRQSVNLVEVNTFRMILIGCLRDLGRFAQWQTLLPGFLRDAETRGDLLADTGLRRVATIVYLAQDRVDLAVENLARTAWPAPEGQFHMQHWFELQARAEIALYQGTLPDIAEWVFDRLDRIHRSLVYRTQALRYNADCLDARVHLALAGSQAGALSHATKLVRRLRREQVPHVSVWADTIAAGIAAHQGDRDGAIVALENATGAAAGLGLGYYAAVTRWRCAALVGDEPRAAALRAAATAWQTSEGVVDMNRMADVIAPGFLSD